MFRLPTQSAVVQWRIEGFRTSTPNAVFSIFKNAFQQTSNIDTENRSSFHRSLRDRLRTVECPADIIDAIGGWVTEGIGHQYGQGHSLTVTHGWMKKLTTKVQEPESVETVT